MDFVSPCPKNQEPCEEVHRNQAAFHYIVQNNLWYTQGLAEAFGKGNAIDFPIDSIEVKSNWVRIEEQEKTSYHWNYDESGQLWGLVATHISSKALPNWFWHLRMAVQPGAL